MTPIIKVAVYGTLKGLAGEGVTSLGKCIIPGALYDLGSFPGLKEDRNRFCIGELLEVPVELLRKLDRYEGYLSENPSESLYVRKLTTVTVGETEVEAFVYYFNRGVSNDDFIENGEWR